MYAANCPNKINPTDSTRPKSDPVLFNRPSWYIDTKNDATEKAGLLEGRRQD